MTLREQGFRYGWTGKKWDWLHPSMVEDGFIDCTYMSDETFEKLVNILTEKPRSENSSDRLI